jgi:LmbE family N-acetylglucosaminyl deacetylase
MNKILVIAPHCDDEILGCGATINKYFNLGHQITALILTNSHIGAPELYTKNKINLIRDQTLKAHKKIGINKTIFFDLPGTELDQFPQRKISDLLKSYLNKMKPTSMFIPFYNDAHIDHKIISSAALIAARPNEKFKIKNIYYYETLSETEWAIGSNSNKFFPNYYEIVSKKNIQNKIKSFKIIKSQNKKHPHPRSLENINHLAQYRGSHIAEKYCESFMIERIISDNDSKNE